MYICTQLEQAKQRTPVPVTVRTGPRAQPTLPVGFVPVATVRVRAAVADSTYAKKRKRKEKNMVKGALCAQVIRPSSFQ